MGKIIVDFDHTKKLSFSTFLASKKIKDDIPPWRMTCVNIFSLSKITPPYWVWYRGAWYGLAGDLSDDCLAA